MSHARKTPRVGGLHRSAGIDISSGGSGSSDDERMVVVLTGVIAAVCFGGAAWAFSSVRPKAYMVSETQGMKRSQGLCKLRVAEELVEGLGIYHVCAQPFGGKRQLQSYILQHHTPPVVLIEKQHSVFWIRNLVLIVARAV